MPLIHEWTERHMNEAFINVSRARADVPQWSPGDLVRLSLFPGDEDRIGFQHVGLVIYVRSMYPRYVGFLMQDINDDL